MGRKTILAIVAVFLAVAVIILAALSFRGGDTADKKEIVDDTSSVEIPAANLNLKVPAGEKIQFGTPSGIIEVNNFYRNVVAAQEQFLIIKRESDYEITYDTTNSEFFVYISGGVFDSVRRLAEEGFLTLLGISKEDACKLDVAIGAAREVSGAPTGIAPLSFCPVFR